MLPESYVASVRSSRCDRGKQLMTTLIESVTTGVPTALTELRTLGRTLKRRAADVLT